MIELEDQRQGDQESRQRGAIGPEPDQARVRGGQEEQNHKAGQRGEQDDREDVVHRAIGEFILSPEGAA